MVAPMLEKTCSICASSIPIARQLRGARKYYRPDVITAREARARKRALSAFAVIAAPPPRMCVICSTETVGSDGRRKYCLSCAQAAKRKRKRSAPYMQRKMDRDRASKRRPERRAKARVHDRIKEHRRRAIERGAAAEKFDPLEILDRDKWKCGLCGISTPKSKRGTYEADAPELDHIIPISAGGPHTRANVQCACRACNMAKGSKLLRLAG